MIKKLLALIVVFVSSVMFIIPTNGVAFGESVADTNVHGESTFDNESVSCVDSEKIITGTSEMFKFVATTDINRIVATGKIKLINYRIKDNNNIIITLSSFASNENVRLDFYFGDEYVDSFSLYFAEGENGYYYSSAFSLDTARRKAGHLLNYAFADDIELDGAEETESIAMDKDISLMSIGVTGSVSGTFRWTDDEGSTHPLIGAKVKITINGSLWSNETYTDQNGYYRFDYNGIWHIGSGKPSIHLYADNGESVRVKNGGIYERTVEMSGNNGSFNCSHTFSPREANVGGDGDIGRAMIIFQAAKNFADYAKSMNNGKSVTSCDFIYPGDPSEGCFYNRNNVVTITSATPYSTFYPNSYASWDVIGHEYGHHIQKCYGIADNPGGRHTIPGNNIDDQYAAGHTLENSKDRGLRLAWAEGWPTYWSTVAQSTFSADLKSIRTVGDTNYTSYNGLDYNLDSYSSNSRGDADEQAVQRVLFKLNSNTTDTFDKFAISAETLFGIVKNNKPHTFYEFVDDLYNAGYNKNELGLLLGQYAMVANNLDVSNQYLDRCPTFKWSTNMGSRNLTYNDFDLVFLNTRGQEVLRINNIESTGSTAQYTLSRNEWSTIISVYGRTYYAYIVARQTTKFISGNYCSQWFELTEPDDFDTKVQIKPNEWGFEPQYFFESNCTGHTTTTITDHGLTITTNRLRCGYIENSYMILSPKRQNAGKAYLELIFDKPVYSYMFGITLWSRSEGLNSADCTAIVEYKDKNGIWHEDMDLMNDLPNGFSVRTQQVDRYEIAHREGIYGIRFVMTAPATGDRNKGRLCIDDIVLNTDPNDLWFISTFYE